MAELEAGRAEARMKVIPKLALATVVHSLSSQL